MGPRLRSDHPKRVVKKDGWVLILDQTLLKLTLKSLKDQTLFSGMDHKEFSRWNHSPKALFKCLMTSLKLLQEELSPLPVVVIPLLSSKESLDLQRNFPMSVQVVVHLLGSLKEN